jgi:hypothetical protein
MSDEPKVLTTGRLDGLVITPIGIDGDWTFLDFTVKDLPGLRLVIEADAARELRDALTIILGPGNAKPT